VAGPLSQEPRKDDSSTSSCTAACISCWGQSDFDVKFCAHCQARFGTSPEVVAEIDALPDQHTNREVIAILNERGRRTGMDKPFNKYALEWVIYNHHIKSRFRRFKETGFLTRREMAEALGLSYWQIKDRQSRGEFRAIKINDKGEWLLNPIDEQSEKIRQLAAEHNRLIKVTQTATSCGGGVV
jgi:hypothetical protein